MEYQIDGQVFPVKVEEGQGFLIHPEQICTYFANKNNPWSYAWVEFSGPSANHALSISGLGLNDPIYIPKDEDTLKRISELMLKISFCKSSNIFELTGLAYLFLDCFSYGSAKIIEKQSSVTKKNLSIQNTLRYIEEHFAENISIEDLAMQVGLSRSYFSRMFKARMAVSPQDYLMNCRMRKAEELLLHSDDSVKEIAPQVGYKNPLNFSRAFKDYYGMSPTEWRKQIE